MAKKIKFLLSPTGKFGLAYNAGDVVEGFEDKQAAELVDAAYATYVLDDDATPKKPKTTDKAKETKAEKEAREKAEKDAAVQEQLDTLKTEALTLDLEVTDAETLDSLTEKIAAAKVQ